MEDSFKVRVDRAFGSLEAAASSSSIPNASAKSTSSSLSSLWCLTDEEIERNEWIRDKVTPYKDTDEEVLRLKSRKPYSSFLEGLLAEPQQALAPSSFDVEASTSHQDLESDIEELDDEDENQQPRLSKPDDHSNEEWDIRSSVGMDCALDNEEEEDGYDKAAVGREESADRFYMKEVNDYEVEIDSNNELPSSLTEVIRDPRANHMAAKLRLKEDDESARKLGLQISSGGSENNNQEDGGCLKSITRENQIATRSKKQVCFEAGGKGDNEEIIGQSGHLVMDKPPGSQVVPLSQDLSNVPDYVCNPSKYTHYTFDSLDDVDEGSNRAAYMEFFNSLKGCNHMEIQDDISTDSPTSIIFTPKKKSSHGLVKKSKVDGYEEYMHRKVVPINIAAGDIQDSEVCAMDEDEPEIATNKGSSLPKGSRRYRTKGSANME